MSDDDGRIHIQRREAIILRRANQLGFFNGHLSKLTLTLTDVLKEVQEGDRVIDDRGRAAVLPI